MSRSVEGNISANNLTQVEGLLRQRLVSSVRSLDLTTVTRIERGYTKRSSAGLTIQLGDSKPSDPATILELISADWRVVLTDSAPVWCGNDPALTEKDLGILLGKHPLNVAVTVPGPDLRVAFEADLTLEIFATTTVDKIHIRLWHTDGSVLTLGPGPKWDLWKPASCAN